MNSSKAKQMLQEALSRQTLMPRGTDKDAATQQLLVSLFVLEQMANTKFDGHLTIMRFTNGWKVMMGTPDLDADGRNQVWNIPMSSTLLEAIDNLLLREYASS